MLTAELDYERKLGCEYEMAIPLVGTGDGRDVRNRLQQVLSSNGLSSIARSYSHAPLPPATDLAVEHDSSVRGQSEWSGIAWHAVEMKSRILTLGEWENIIPKALLICSYMGARVNRSCGHHVHLSFTEMLRDPRVIRSLYNLFLRFERVIYGLVAPSRGTNGYSSRLDFKPDLFKGCRSVPDFCLAIQDEGLRREHGLNLTHLENASPRIEFRYHHGTLSPEKARHWLRFLLQMVKHAVTRSCHSPREQVANDRKGIEKLLISCGFKPNNRVYKKVCPELRETGKWLLGRWKHFNQDQQHALRPTKKIDNGGTP